MHTLKRNYILTLSTLCFFALTACGTKSQDTTDSDQTKAKPVVEAKQILDKVNNTIDTAVESKMSELENIEVGNIFSDPNAYLAMNAKKANVITTASGLQYRVITKGDGAKPDISSTVRVHYRGSFTDGSEFDSSYKRNKPTEFPVTGVIAGWTEALLLMNEGSKWELVIPPELAYGEKGAGNVIPPNQVLKFDVELISADISK